MSEELKCKVKGGCGYVTTYPGELAEHEKKCTGKGLPSPSKPDQTKVTKGDKALGWGGGPIITRM